MCPRSYYRKWVTIFRQTVGLEKKMGKHLNLLKLYNCKIISSVLYQVIRYQVNSSALTFMLSCRRIENCSNMCSKIGIQQYTIQHLYVQCIQLIFTVSSRGLTPKKNLSSLLSYAGPCTFNSLIKFNLTFSLVIFINIFCFQLYILGVSYITANLYCICVSTCFMFA